MSRLFPLEFHAPTYLIGLLAALIPLIIHLSRSRRTKKIRFSTTRFFTDQFLRSYRMSRLRELLLLACRMLLFAMFAMALAAPFLPPRANSGSTMGQGSRAVVLVVDNSASMGYKEGDEVLLERASKAALTVLAALRPGDSAGLVLATRRDPASGPEVLVPPTNNLDEVRQKVADLRVATVGTNLTAAISRAEVLASAAQADTREVWVFSDLQDSGWELQTTTAPSDPAKVGFVFVGVRPHEASNIGIRAIQFGSNRPWVGMPFSFRPLITSSGDATEAIVRLFIYEQDRDTLELKANLVSERTVTKQTGGRWAIERFHHTFQTGGWHAGYIVVEAKSPNEDNLKEDNRRYFALEVLEGVKLLTVNGAPSRDAELDGLYYLRMVLAAADTKTTPVQVEEVTPADLESKKLEQYRVVVLANVESLPESAVEKLETFVAEGGSLFVALGDRVASAAYNSTLGGTARRFGGLLPAQLKEVAAPGSATEGTFIGSVDFRHPALAPFQDPKHGNLVGSGGVLLRRFWRVEAPEDTVLMRAADADRSPLLCEKAFGKGKVILFTSTCDSAWTNFPARGNLFVPWVHRLVTYLAQDPQQSFHETGAQVRLLLRNVDPASPPLIKMPDPKRGIATAERSTDEVPVYLFNETEEAGVYTVVTPDRKVLSLFAVNLDSYESDLTYLDDVLAGDEQGDKRSERIETAFKEDLLRRPVVTYVADDKSVTETGTTAGQGRGLWDVFLIIVLLIGLFEPWLANRISVRLYGRPRVAPEVAMPLPASAAAPATVPTPAPAVEGSLR
jgi:hypothetical protein